MTGQFFESPDFRRAAPLSLHCSRISSHRFNHYHNIIVLFTTHANKFKRGYDIAGNRDDQFLRSSESPGYFTGSGLTKQEPRLEIHSVGVEIRLLCRLDLSRVVPRVRSTRSSYRGELIPRLVARAGSLRRLIPVPLARRRRNVREDMARRGQRRSSRPGCTLFLY